MRTITQHVCGVIPPHILTRVAERTDHTAHEAARTTLEQMRELATERARTFLDRGAAAKAESGRGAGRTASAPPGSCAARVPGAPRHRPR